MNRADAVRYIAYCVDDALSERQLEDVPWHSARLVGWQCGFEPMFVAVWSYLDARLSDDEARDLAVDLLFEKGWFASEVTEPDYIF